MSGRGEVWAPIASIHIGVIPSEAALQAERGISRERHGIIVDYNITQFAMNVSSFAL